MAIDYSAASGLAFPKGQTRVVDRIQKKRDLEQQEREARKAVDKRDGRRCFFPGCKAVASEKHHLTARSVRGKTIWRTDDLISACAEHHRLFKAGLIRVEGNPDHRESIKVSLTTLGIEAGLRLPKRKGGVS